MILLAQHSNSDKTVPGGGARRPVIFGGRRWGLGGALVELPGSFSDLGGAVSLPSPSLRRHLWSQTPSLCALFCVSMSIKIVYLKNNSGSCHCGTVETNPTNLHEDVGSPPGLAQWVRDLWYRPVVVALIRPLVWELSQAVSVALKCK